MMVIVGHSVGRGSRTACLCRWSVGWCSLAEKLRHTLHMNINAVKVGYAKASVLEADLSSAALFFIRFRARGHTLRVTDGRLLGDLYLFHYLSGHYPLKLCVLPGFNFCIAKMPSTSSSCGILILQ